MPDKKNKILCKFCNSESWLKKEPVYDDNFKKKGEKLLCASCGHIYTSEKDVPYIEKRAPAIFSDEDKEPKIDLFKDDKEIRNCRHCKHYVVNPFTQRCGLHFRKVEATDTCADFSPKKEEK